MTRRDYISATRIHTILWGIRRIVRHDQEFKASITAVGLSAFQSGRVREIIYGNDAKRTRSSFILQKAGTSVAQ